MSKEHDRRTDSSRDETDRSLVREVVRTSTIKYRADHPIIFGLISALFSASRRRK